MNEAATKAGCEILSTGSEQIVWWNKDAQCVYVWNIASISPLGLQMSGYCRDLITLTDGTQVVEYEDAAPWEEPVHDLGDVLERAADGVLDGTWSQWAPGGAEERDRFLQLWGDVGDPDHTARLRAALAAIEF